MELILHIGLSKTGTSAIQNFLWKNREFITEKFALLYPEAGIFNAGGIHAHHHIAWSIYKPETVNVEVVPTTQEILNNLLKELLNSKRKNIKKLIISSETFMQIKDKNSYIKLKNFIEQLHVAKVEIIVYFRRQDLWHESSYLQVMKDGSIKTTPFKLSNKYSLNYLGWLLEYDQFLERWQSAFPEARIIPRIYYKRLLPKGNVILDFLSVIGIEMPEKETKVEVNLSISHLSALALRRINEIYDFPREIHEKLVSFVLKLDKEEPSPLKSFFTLEERIEFLERFRESNERLFKEWFNSENLFVLSQEEIEFYKQQDEILKDKEYLEKLVNERYEKAMEFLVKEVPEMGAYRKKNVAKVVVPVSKEPGIYGYVDVVNLQKIAGWILDLEENKPAEVEVRINGIKVFEGKASLERKDVMEVHKVDIPAGFEIYMKEIVLPSEIRELPEDRECVVEVLHKRTGKLIQGNYRTFTAKELKNTTRLSKDFPYVRYVMNESVREYVEFVSVDQLFIDVLNNGKLSIGGVVAIKKEYDQSEFKLVVKDVEREKEVQWFLPSPWFAQNHPDNPNAKKARYRIDGVVVHYNFPAEFYLKKGQVSFNILEVVL